MEYSSNHYDFTYKVKEGETEIRVDPYFVSDVWRLGEPDNTGCLFHLLKTIARYGLKNTEEREIRAMYDTIRRMAELKGIEL